MNEGGSNSGPGDKPPARFKPASGSSAPVVPGGGTANGAGPVPAPSAPAETAKPGSGGQAKPSSSGQLKPASGSGSGVQRPSGSGMRPGQGAQQIVLGGYRIVERIGAGGMGTVYRAVHVELDREVALKVLPPEMNSNPIMVARFKREARAAAQLQHDNIVQIFDVKEDKGRNFLALEFVRGQDLSDLITARKHLPVKESIEILKQAAQALDHAFQKGIVHRDIKPSNFLITAAGKVKLCDMGLALRTDAGDEAKVTRDGTTVGTVDYMAPEQARDSRLADTRSDIYSLGCTLYQMLTGRVPFEEGSIPEKLYKHNQDPIPDPLQFNPDIPDQVLYVLNRMLEKKPEDRYQNPKELLSDLEQLELDQPKSVAVMKTLAIGAEEDEAGTESIVLQRPGSRSGLQRAADREAVAQQKRLIQYISGGCAALIVLGLVVWFVSRTGGPPGELAAGPNLDRKNHAEIFKPDPGQAPSASTVPAPAANSTPGQPAASLPPVTKTPDPIPGPPTKSPTEEPDAADRDRKTDANPPQKLPGTTIDSEPKRVSEADREKLSQELFPPWPTVAIPTTPVKLARGIQQERGGVFATFEAACRSAQAASKKIDIEDSGPFFQRSFSVNKANLEVRPVYPEKIQNPWRPVVVYDRAAAKGDNYFFQAKSSNLVIEGIDFVLNADDLKESIGLNAFALFDVQGGDLVLRNCTFTILGKHALPVSLVKFHGLREPDTGRQPERLARLTLENCFARGESLTAVTLATGLADVKIIDSLFVGGQMGTMFELLGASEPTARPERTVRFIRSSFVTRGDFLLLDGSSGDIPTHFKLLDTIIACSAPGSARKLVKFKGWPDQSGVMARSTWDERSSLYTGWGENLAYSVPPGKLAAKNTEEWLKLWGRQPADSEIRPAPWPSQDLGDLAAVSTASFHSAEVAAGIQSRWGAEFIGCNVERLPGLSPMLLERSFGALEPGPLLPIEQLIPSHTTNGQKNPMLGKWQSEQSRRRSAPAGSLAENDQLDSVLELTFNATSATDLGQFIMAQPELAQTTIVSVTGTGMHPMSPIRLTDKKSLIIYVKQAQGQVPLTLVPAEAGSSEAMIEVRDGDLILEGVVMAIPAGAEGSMPRRFIKVDRGNLTMSGCRLYGPLSGNTGFEAIAFAGSTQKSQWPDQPASPVHMDFHPAPHPRVNALQLHDSYVGAELRCFAVNGAEVILKLSNCIIVSPGTVASFDELDAVDPQKFEAGVILDQCTIAASKTFFEIGEWLAPVAPNRPISFYTRNSLFCDPFDVNIGASARGRSNVLLRYGGRTLQQGLICWHSEYDAFSNDMHGYIQRKDSSANPRQEFDQHWQSVWGSLHIKNEIVDGKKIEKIRLAAKPTMSATPKLKDFERDRKLADLALQDQCEAAKKASHGGKVGADPKRIGQ